MATYSQRVRGKLAFMAKSQNVTRDILLSLGAAAVFAVGLVAYLLHSMPSRAELETSYIEPKNRMPQGPDDLEVARAVLSRFTAALAAKRFDEAYALMAEPYRQNASLATFRASCAASPFVAQAERTTLFSTRRMLPGGVVQDPYTLDGTGVITGHAGSINAKVTLLVSSGDARILVLTLAGVPVLNGVTGAVQN
jgi:hypothetical protein